MKKKKNIKQELAKKAYLDPKSPTFMNKTKSMITTGYSKTYAEHRGWELLDNSSFTDTDLANFKPLVEGLPKLVALTNKKLEQLAESNSISAKDYSAMLKHIELIAKCAGILKQTIEKRVETIHIGIPLQKCPECGYIMDYLKEESEGSS